MRFPLKANAIKDLAKYRALQSALNIWVKYIETFEVLKMCFDKDFRLLTVPCEKIRGDGNGMTGPIKF
jgi:hypothetical protein